MKNIFKTRKVSLFLLVVVGCSAHVHMCWLCCDVPRALGETKFTCINPMQLHTEKLARSSVASTGL